MQDVPHIFLIYYIAAVHQMTYSLTWILECVQCLVLMLPPIEEEHNLSEVDQFLCLLNSVKKKMLINNNVFN